MGRAGTAVRALTMSLNDLTQRSALVDGAVVQDKDAAVTWVGIHLGELTQKWAHDSVQERESIDMYHIFYDEIKNSSASTDPKMIRVAM